MFLKRTLVIFMSSLWLLVGCGPQDAAYENGRCISIRVDIPMMYINGQGVPLSESPFMRNNVLFVPYDAIASAFEGTSDYDASTNTVSSAFPQRGTMLRESSVQFVLDSSNIHVDGVEEVPAGLGTDFANGDITVYKAQQVNGTIYVPIDYFQRFGVASVWQAAESDRATVSNLSERLGAGPFELEENFWSLDDSITSSFSATGILVYDYGGEKREIYTDGHADILLATSQDGENGVIKAITLKDGFYKTDRCLQVGDSEERALDLYAGNNFNLALTISISDGIVSEISFESFL